MNVALRDRATFDAGSQPPAPLRKHSDHPSKAHSSQKQQHRPECDLCVVHPEVGSRGLDQRPYVGGDRRQQSSNGCEYPEGDRVDGKAGGHDRHGLA